MVEKPPDNLLENAGLHGNRRERAPAEANIWVSGNYATVEHAVALGESGFGYDVAMIVASLADLLEPMDEVIHGAMASLQKRIKYGITHPQAIAFFEAGFSDRIVASALGERWPQVADRAGVRAICRRDAEAMRAMLSRFPSYFTTVADELGR